MTCATRVTSTALLLAALALLPVPTAGAAPVSDAECDGLPATIVGTNGRDRIVGTPGDDVIAGLGNRDRIRGGGGDDVICGGPADDRLDGGPGNDRLLGEGNRRGPDREHYGDLLVGGRGDDFMDGGDDVGFDYLSYEKARSGVELDRAAGTVTGKHSGNDTFIRLGAIVGTDFDDVLIDDDSDSYIQAGAGNDRVETGGGFNYVYGETGDDTLIGGLYVDQIRGGEGDDVIETGDGYLNYLWGDAGNDTMTGGSGRDDLYGGLGNDQLDGAGGDDPYVQGDEGDDLLSGGPGADHLDGGADVDFGDGGTESDVCANLEDSVSCEAAPLALPDDADPVALLGPDPARWVLVNVRTG